MRHTEMINNIIAACQYESYLEIGLGNGVNFKKILLKDKTGIDPNVPTRAREGNGVTLKSTSDRYFHRQTRQFDFIFIDGLHHADQVLRDINNALQALAPGGRIMVHDCNPPSYEAQIVPRRTRVWTGDVWKAWVKLRARSDIHQVCIAEDYGCGMIRKAAQTPLIVDPLSYRGLELHRKQWLNLKPWKTYYESNYLQRKSRQI